LGLLSASFGPTLATRRFRAALPGLIGLTLGLAFRLPSHVSRLPREAHPATLETQFSVSGQPLGALGLFLAALMCALPFGEPLSRAFRDVITHLVFIRYGGLRKGLAGPFGACGWGRRFSRDAAGRGRADTHRDHGLLPIMRPRHHAQVDIHRLVGLRGMHRFDWRHGRDRHRNGDYFSGASHQHPVPHLGRPDDFLPAMGLINRIRDRDLAGLRVRLTIRQHLGAQVGAEGWNPRVMRGPTVFD
jgi:hypothetical protein